MTDTATSAIRPDTPLLLAALLASNAPATFAESPDATTDAELETVVVLGQRASLRSAQGIKRDRLEIVDSVVADDILSLPDLSVSDALQRITGVQITRDRGEAAAVSIRGLTQMETTLNGREVFTAGSDRSLNFSDYPAEMIASIVVNKTSSADHIEGGVGGLVDLRTHRPFDFNGNEIAASARVNHGFLIDETRGQYSALASGRWKTEGESEFGALLNVSWQERAWREDQKGTGNPVARADLIPGQVIAAPNGTSETTSVGTRERLGVSAVLQWRPWPTLDLYAEGNYAEFRTLQDSHQINVLASRTFVPGSAAVFPGTNDLARITWTNAPISILSFARDTVDRTKQAAIGGSWTRGALTLRTDVSYTDSFNNLFFSGPFFAGTAANFTHDVSSPLPGTAVSGTDLLDPANFRYTGIAYRTRPFDGDLSTAQFDGTYRIARGFIKTLDAGMRYARRGATNEPGLIVADAPVTGIAAAQTPQFIMPNPYNDFFPDESTASIRNFIVGNLDMARDAAGLRSAFGITTPIPAAASPLSIWQIKEKTSAAYLLARFEMTSLPLDGNLGLRAVRTHEELSGNQSVPGTSAVAPIDRSGTYTDYLPSANLRYRLREGLYLRAALSQTLTRPNFDQLSPSLTLLRNPTNPELNQGAAGNPDLQPIRADNFDLAIEEYFNATTSLFFTAFLKRVDGFVTTVSEPETYDGVTYQVSRPRNNTTADIKGFEAGYQQFYDFLPGWLSGFGIQANYTFVDSETPDKTLGMNVPLQNLSRHSLNFIGMYERGKLSARLAYNWRDKFLSGVTNVVGIGALPIYTRDYSWLDASVSYRFDDRISVAIEGVNLLATMRRSYYGVQTRPQSNWVNDTQISATATLRF